MNLFNKLFKKDEVYENRIAEVKNNQFINDLRLRLLQSEIITLDYFYTEWEGEKTVYCFVLDGGYVIKVDGLTIDFSHTEEDIEKLYKEMLDLLYMLKEKNKKYVL